METLLNILGVGKTTQPEVAKEEVVVAKKEVVRKEETKVVESNKVVDQREVVIEKAPVVHEIFRTQIVEEIQPVIHREIEQPEIHRVVQPVFEKKVEETDVKEVKMESQYKEAVITKPSADFIAKRSQPQGENTIDFQATKTVIEKQPIIYEHKVKTIIEEVQPVIHREVVKPELIKERIDIYEKYVEAPIYVEETRAPLISTEYPKEVKNL